MKPELRPSIYTGFWTPPTTRPEVTMPALPWTSSRTAEPEERVSGARARTAAAGHTAESWIPAGHSQVRALRWLLEQCPKAAAGSGATAGTGIRLAGLVSLSCPPPPAVLA